MLLLFLCWSIQLKASCCASGSTGGIGRLLPHERALVEVSQDVRRVVGHFQEASEFVPGVGDDQPLWQLNHEIQVMARLATFFQPFVKIPVRTQIGPLRTGSAIADLSFGARWPLLEEHFLPHWPALHLFSIAQAPTGTSMDDKKLYMEEITGSGAWLLSLGATFEKTFGSFLWALGYTYSMEPRLLKREDFANGPTHAPSISFSFPVIDMHTLSFSFGGTFNEPLHYDGKRVRNSSRRKLTLSGVYAWKFHSHMTLNFSVGSDIPIVGLGKNNKSEIFGRVGMRVGVF